jgi:hypothetical protein
MVHFSAQQVAIPADAALRWHRRYSRKQFSQSALYTSVGTVAVCMFTYVDLQSPVQCSRLHSPTTFQLRRNSHCGTQYAEPSDGCPMKKET